MPNELLHFILHYGYIAIFIFVFLGVFIIPLPVETLMVVLGTFIGQGKLHLLPTLLSSIAGALLAMIIGYKLGGTLGISFLQKVTSALKIKESTVLYSQNLFKKYGKLLILFGFFIPGVRNFISFLAGISTIPYTRYLSLSILGSTMWCLTFYTVGHTFNHYMHFLLRHVYFVIPIFIFGLLLYWSKPRIIKFLAIKMKAAKEYE